MASIVLSQTELTICIGWYGTCGTCKSLPFDDASISDAEPYFDLIYQINESGLGYETWNSAQKALYQWVPPKLKSFECGNSYWLILKPHSGATEADRTIEIPGFTEAKYNSGDNGSLTDSCDVSGSTASNEIVLSQTELTICQGWYGTCGSDCGSLPFDDASISDAEPYFDLIYQINESGLGYETWNSAQKALYQWVPPKLKSFECGNSYWLILKPHSGATEAERTITIPGFVSAKYNGTPGGVITDTCVPVVEPDKLWISFTGNNHYSDWYELETEEEDFTKFKIATPNYGSDLYTWASGKTTNLQGILITASPDRPSSSTLTDEQKAKTFNSDLLNFNCDGTFNANHGVNPKQINLRVQAYNNQKTPSLKKYGSEGSTHGYLENDKPWSGANMVYRTTTFSSIVIDDSGGNSIDIDYLYFIKETDESAKIKFSEAPTKNSICGLFDSQ